MISESTLPVRGGFRNDRTRSPMNNLPQDAFSPRRRGMDRRPLSEGFDVGTFFVAFPPQL